MKKKKKKFYDKNTSNLCPGCDAHLSLSRCMSMTPVLNPLPRAGQGLSVILPGRYQSSCSWVRPSADPGKKYLSVHRMIGVPVKILTCLFFKKCPCLFKMLIDQGGSKEILFIRLKHPV